MEPKIKFKLKKKEKKSWEGNKFLFETIGIWMKMKKYLKCGRNPIGPISLAQWLLKLANFSFCYSFNRHWAKLRHNFYALFFTCSSSSSSSLFGPNANVGACWSWGLMGFASIMLGWTWTQKFSENIFSTVKSKYFALCSVLLGPFEYLTRRQRLELRNRRPQTPRPKSSRVREHRMLFLFQYFFILYDVLHW